MDTEQNMNKKFRIFLRIMLLGGQKHHFLQDSMHISKFCAVNQILRKIPRAQNRRFLEGLHLDVNIRAIFM